MSELHFRAGINDQTLQADIARINKTISQWSQHTQREAANVDRTFQKLGGVIAGYFSINFAANFAKQIATVRGEFQQLEVAFETMLGNKSEADKLMAQVVELASTTPFELQEVAGGAKALLAFGTEASDIIPTLRALGDVSAGLSVPIERLIMNFGQVKTQARLTGRELKDFQVSGVPIVAELAKNLNKTEKEIGEMVSAGRIGFKEVEEAFKSMAGEGGRFENLMAKQSKTITGMISNLKDAWAQMMESMGRNNEGAITGVITTAKSVVENYTAVIDILKVLIATYGSYKAAMIAMNVIESYRATSLVTSQVQGYMKMVTVTRQLTALQWLQAKAQTAVNAAMSINPYVALATVITSIVALFLTYNKRLKETAEGAASLSNRIDTATQAISAQVNELERLKEIEKSVERFRELSDKISKSSQELTEFNRLAKDLKEIGLADNVDGIEKYLETAKKAAGLQLESAKKTYETLITEAKKRADELQKQIESGTRQTIERVYTPTGGGGGYWAEKVINETLGLEQLEAASNEYIILLGKIQDYTNNLGKLQGGGNAEVFATVKEQIKEVQQQIKEAEADLEEMRKPDSTASVDDIKAQQDRIKDLQSQYEILTGITKKANQELAKSEQERLSAYQDYLDSMVSLTMEAEAKKVDLLTDGAEKQRQLAELSYQQELQQIEKQRKDALELYNKSLKIGQPQATQLPDDIQQQFDELRELAEKQKAQKIEQINKETSEKVKEIWKQATDFFLSEQEREIIAVNDKYDQLVEAAQKIGDNDLVAQLQKTRTAELEKIDREYAIKRIDMQAEVVDYLQQQAEMEVIFNRKKYVELLNLALEYQKSILNMKRSDPAVSEAEIKEIETKIKTIENAIVKFKNASTQELTSIIVETISFLGEYNEIFKGMSTIASGIGRMISGDLTGFLQIFKGIIQLFDLQGSKEEERYKSMVQTMNSYIDNIDLQFEMIGRSIERAFGEDKLNGFRKGIQAVGRDISWAITELNRMAKVSLVLPDKDAIIGYRGDSTSGVGSRPGSGKPIYGYSIEGIERAIAENEKRIAKLTLEYERSGDERVGQVLETYQRWVSELYNLRDTYFELLTGTTPGGIADAIVEGFRQGKRSAQDFADDFEGMIKQALISAMKLRVLEEPIARFYSEFATSMEDGILTDEERAALRASYDNIIEMTRMWSENVEKALGFDPFGPGSQEQRGMAGQIKGITEETASLIAGQFYAFRELQQNVYEVTMQHTSILNESLKYLTMSYGVHANQLETARMQLDVVNQSVTHLAAIERNTKYNAELVVISQKLSDMNNYLKNL